MASTTAPKQVHNTTLHTPWHATQPTLPAALHTVVHAPLNAALRAALHAAPLATRLAAHLKGSPPTTAADGTKVKKSSRKHKMDPSKANRIKPGTPEFYAFLRQKAGDPAAVPTAMHKLGPAHTLTMPKIVTWNVAGIQDKIKRGLVHAEIRSMRADVCFLQETHCGEDSFDGSGYSQSTADQWQIEWGGILQPSLKEQGGHSHII